MCKSFESLPGTRMVLSSTALSSKSKPGVKVKLYKAVKAILAQACLANFLLAPKKNKKCVNQFDEIFQKIGIFFTNSPAPSNVWPSITTDMTNRLVAGESPPHSPISYFSPGFNSLSNITGFLSVFNFNFLAASKFCSDLQKKKRKNIQNQRSSY